MDSFSNLTMVIVISENHGEFWIIPLKLVSCFCFLTYTLHSPPEDSGCPVQDPRLCSHISRM